MPHSLRRSVYCFVVLAWPAFSQARSVRESVPWGELTGRLDGKQVQVGLADASLVAGKVTRLTAEEIVIRGASRAESSVKRADVKYVRYDVVKGKARARWTVALLLSGVAAATFLGASEQLGGENASHFVPAAIVLGAGGGAAGYAIGRTRDRSTVILAIEPP